MSSAGSGSSSPMDSDFTFVKHSTQVTLSKQVACNLLETERCPYCGASVNKENLGGHVERVHAKRSGSFKAESKTVTYSRSSSVFQTHRRRNIMVLSLVAIVLIPGIYFLITSSISPPAPGTYPGPAAAGTQAESNYLSQMHTDACHWPGVNLGDQTANVNWINSLSDTIYLQGACCSPMDYQPDYASQIPALQNYSSISVIAPDPYNVPGHIAKADVAS